MGFIAGRLKGLRVGQGQEGLIVEHLLEMGNEPLPVGAVAVEAKAELVADPPRRIAEGSSPPSGAPPAPRSAASSGAERRADGASETSGRCRIRRMHRQTVPEAPQRSGQGSLRRSSPFSVRGCIRWATVCAAAFSTSSRRVSQMVLAAGSVRRAPAVPIGSPSGCRWPQRRGASPAS